MNSIENNTNCNLQNGTICIDDINFKDMNQIIDLMNKLCHNKCAVCLGISYKQSDLQIMFLKRYDVIKNAIICGNIIFANNLTRQMKQIYRMNNSLFNQEDLCKLLEFCNKKFDCSILLDVLQINYQFELFDELKYKLIINYPFIKSDINKSEFANKLIRKYSFEIDDFKTVLNNIPNLNIADKKKQNLSEWINVVINNFNSI